MISPENFDRKSKNMGSLGVTLWKGGIRSQIDAGNGVFWQVHDVYQQWESPYKG